MNYNAMYFYIVSIFFIFQKTEVILFHCYGQHCALATVAPSWQNSPHTSEQFNCYDFYFKISILFIL